MNFTRRKVRGRTQKTYREWTNDDGSYRITWRNEVAGVRIRAGYHATVLSVNHAGHTFWSFCTRRSPFKTYALALEACEKNQRLWQAFIAIADSERKGRAERVRALDAKAKIGSGAAAHKVMSVLPVWVKAAAEPFLLRILFPVGRRQADDECDDSSPSNDPSTQPEASASSEANSPGTQFTSADSQPNGSSNTPKRGHASDVEAREESLTLSTSPKTSRTGKSGAKRAKVRAPAAKPKSKRPTKKRGKRTVKQ